MRRAWLPLIFVLGCTTSAWERHKAQFHQQEADGHYGAAVHEAQWLIDNAFDEAPPEEQTLSAETNRHLALSRVAAKSGDSQLAVNTLRESLMINSNAASAVGKLFNELPLDPATRARFKAEFGWNTAALAPDDASPPTADPPGGCWSYSAREIRIRHDRTVKSAEGPERVVTYDARLWTFDATTHRWHADGEWIADAGTAVEPVAGPPAPRYRAVHAADHGFYTDERIPACHRDAWRGPFLDDGTVFVSAHLPGTGPPPGD